MAKNNFNKNQFSIIFLALALVYVITLLNNLYVSEIGLKALPLIIPQDIIFYLIPLIEIVAFSFMILFLLGFFGFYIPKDKGFYGQILIFSLVYGVITGLLQIASYNSLNPNFLIAIGIFRVGLTFIALIISKYVITREF